MTEHLTQEEAEVLDQFTHYVGIVSCKPINEEEDLLQLYHAVAYPEKPSQTDLDLLVEELAEDEEIGLRNMVFGEDYKIIDITKEAALSLISE